jgi:PEP-CTERM motif
MRTSKVWLVFCAFVICAMAATSVQASYVRGYVKPSGDGDQCSASPTTPSCVDFSSGILTFGPSTGPTGYQIIDVTGITDGTEVNFLFSGGVPANTSTSPFSVLVCAYESEGNPVTPGIYTSGGKNLNSPCTQLGDYSISGDFTDPSTFITDDNCTIANTVCYTFGGSGLPGEWVFVESETGPAFVSATVIQPTTPTPEPASLSLLALGIAGLGALRRKRTA